MKRKIITFMVLIAICLFGGYEYLKYNAGTTASSRIQGESITVNGSVVRPCGGSVSAAILPGFINKSVTTAFAADCEKLVIDASGGMIHVDSRHPFIVNIYRNGEAIGASDSDVQLYERGLYDVEIFVNIPYSDGISGEFTYTFMIDVPHPQVTFSNLNPVQGELVTGYVDGLLHGDVITVDSPVFSLSGVYYTDDAGAIFYIPITYYQATGNYNINVNINGELLSETLLSVGKFDFSVISFDVDEDTTAATVNSRRANAEYRREIHPLYYTKDENIYWDGVMVKPVEETRISSEFGQIRYINGSKTPERHSGIDYAAPTGTPVYAPAAGKVEFAGYLMLSGNTVVIDHGLGLKSYFFHLDDVACAAGEIVSTGDLIGHVGSTGYATGPHLHFQVSIENHPVNPQLLYRQ